MFWHATVSGKCLAEMFAGDFLGEMFGGCLCLYEVTIWEKDGGNTRYQS